MPPPDWSLKDESLALLRRWYLLAAAALIGGLMGWAWASVAPAYYEAEVPLTVTFNNDAIFLTPDDYKNGQLAELSDFVVSEELLGLTLAELHRRDDLFLDWTVTDLMGMVEPRWRNIGVWQLTAQHEDSRIAGAVAQIWSDTVIEETAAAIEKAVLVEQLDRRLTAQARSLDAVGLDRAVYVVLLQDLESWQVAPEDVDALLLFADRLANLELRAGATTFPSLDPEALIDDPPAWANAAAAALRVEIGALERLQAELGAEYDALGDDWLAARVAARGLSAYLLVERSDRPIGIPVPIYRTGDLILAGALIGVLLLIGVRFGRIVLRKP